MFGLVEVSEKQEDNSLYVRVKTSYYMSGKSLVEKRELYPLLRKSSAGLVDLLYEDASIFDDYVHIFGYIKEDGIYMLNFHTFTNYEGVCDDGEWSVVKVENE